MIEIPLSKTGKHKGKYVAIVDDCDSELVELNWAFTAIKNASGYAVRTVNRKSQLMHRVILERMIAPRKLESHEQVDHIDGNGLNNQRKNLRVATPQQNTINRKKPTNNKSGYKGVFWREDRRCWAAMIAVNRRNIYLGHYQTPQEAHAAYCKKATELYGEFANGGDNSIIEKDGLEPVRIIRNSTGFKNVRFNEITGTYRGEVIVKGIKFYFGPRDTALEIYELIQEFKSSKQETVQHTFETLKRNEATP